MRRLRRLAALALSVVACGDDGRADSTTTATTATTATTSPATLTEPDPTTSSSGPTTGGPNGTTGDATTDAPETTSTTDTSTGPVSSTSTDGTTTGPMPCAEDQIVCDGDTAKVCDGTGGFKSEETCPMACAPGLGCVDCVPGETQCEGDQVVQCNDMGAGFDIVETCDGLLGLACDPDAGACAGPCAGLGLSYIGCDYYPTVLQQNDAFNGAPHEFAVAVANTSDQQASVTVTRAGAMVAQVMVAPMSVQLVKLPWINELTKGQGPSIHLVDGAYRLRSTRPVTVYQYNPLAATVSNDASLLLPVNTWTGNYLVAAWQSWNFVQNSFYPGFYAVVAREDGTTVTLHPSATGKLVQAGGGVAADGTGVVTLDADDVLQVVSAQGGDLTGTIIEANKPVQVFGGHECTNVPVNVTACDHLEEAIFPIETLAKEYVVVPPVQVPNDALDKAQMVRVIASEANTALTFNPDQPVAKNLANPGDFVELAVTTARFVVTADKKILVSQYMVGQSGGYGTSDPSMLLAISPAQWRSDYLVHAPTNWVANYVDLIAETGAQVTVDGVAVPAWAPIGNSGYAVAHVKLDNGGDGNHRITADSGVSVAVSGVLNAGSYWYPGGLDLNVIPQ